MSYFNNFQKTKLEIFLYNQNLIFFHLTSTLCMVQTTLTKFSGVAKMRGIYLLLSWLCLFMY